jgi:hypothetical protein
MSLAGHAARHDSNTVANEANERPGQLTKHALSIRQWPRLHCSGVFPLFR